MHAVAKTQKDIARGRQTLILPVDRSLGGQGLLVGLGEQHVLLILGETERVILVGPGVEAIVVVQIYGTSAHPGALWNMMPTWQCDPFFCHDFAEYHPSKYGVVAEAFADGTVCEGELEEGGRIRPVIGCFEDSGSLFAKLLPEPSIGARAYEVEQGVGRRHDRGVDCAECLIGRISSRYEVE